MPFARFAAAVSLALCVLAASAKAETDREILAGFGLFGSWAADCNQPPSPQVPYAVFTVQADGTVLRLLRIGNDKQHDYDYRVSAVVRVAPDQVAMHLGNDRTAFDVVLQFENHRQRAYQSKAADGSVVIKDGILVRDGSATIWQSRCGD